MNYFRNARFTLDPNEIVPREVREKYESLPDTAVIRDREVDIEYDVEERDGSNVGVARLRLPEKLARSLAAEEVPVLDRPLRFVVIRGQRGAIRADSLEELQEALERPWSPDEVEEAQYAPEHESRDERKARELASRRRKSKSRRDERERHRGPRGERPGKKGSRGERFSSEAAREERNGSRRKRGARRKFRGR
jgi:hypothetical protein